MVLPLGPWVTVRSRAPLMELSLLETKFPPTVMLFLICRSWDWAATAARAMKQTTRDSLEGIIHSLFGPAAIGRLPGWLTVLSSEPAVGACELPSWLVRRNQGGDWVRAAQVSFPWIPFG